MSVESADFDNQITRIEGNFNNPECVMQAAMFVQAAAKMNAPVGISGDLRNSIFVDSEETDTGIEAEVYTPPGHYALYVELGTGKRGAQNHAGISPNVHPTYTMDPWWIHESQLNPGVGERYHWLHIDTPDGRFYRCEGQPAQPFLYPALNDNRQRVLEILKEGFNKAIEES